MVQYWLIVYDAGPTLSHHWLNVSCSLGYRQKEGQRSTASHVCRMYFRLCDVDHMVTFSVHFYKLKENVVLVLCICLLMYTTLNVSKGSSQHWLNHTYSEHTSSQQTQSNCITFIQRRPNVFDVGPTLYKCYTYVLCLLGYIRATLHIWFADLFMWPAIRCDRPSLPFIDRR